MSREKRDWLKDLPGYIESSLLCADGSRGRITELCDEAAREGFFGVCVNPTHIRFVRRLLEGGPVKTVTVVGFPLGANTTAVKVYEAADAVARGADEVDMVMNVSAFLHGYEEFVRREVSDVVAATDGRPVKVIIETALLSDEETKRAAEVAVSGGAVFVKTSTGFAGGAAEKDVALIRAAVGDRAGVKAAGGIRSYDEAISLIDAGADRIGTSAAGAIMEGLRFARESGKL